MFVNIDSVVPVIWRFWRDGYGGGGGGGVGLTWMPSGVVGVLLEKTNAHWPVSFFI